MARYQRGQGEQRATAIELFYDLVFVFAITQVSHLLLHHLTFGGVAQATLVLFVVWWAWNYTTWVTNELDADSIAVRLLLIGIMLATLVMAVAIPDAFGAHGLLFAGAYVVIQVGRHLFLTFVAAPGGTIERERAAQILIWFALAGVFWIAGGLAHGAARSLLWAIAVIVDYAAPVAVFRVPGRPALDVTTWNVETAHFAERFQLFIIIALGESIVVTGATASQLEIGVGRVAALSVAFLVSAALWWFYFDYVARIAERRLELAADRTRLARDAYTYLHVVMVAGIIVSAVGDGLVIARPTDVVPAREVAAIVSGPALYLVAQTLFRLRLAGSLSFKRLGGAVGCVAVGLLGGIAPALVIAILVLAVLVVVIAAERVAGSRRRARGEPSPVDRLAAEGTGEH